MTLEELQGLFPDATSETWHQHSNGGGWVENTARVDESAYVGEDARVHGSAQVHGNAQVRGSARVCGNAQVHGNALVYGSAQVCGDIWIINPLHIHGTRHTVTTCKYGFLQIGCYSESIKWWKKHYKAVGRMEGYSKEQIAEYGLYIALAEDWFKIHGLNEKGE